MTATVLESSRLDALSKQKRSQVAKAIFMVIIVMALSGLIAIQSIVLDRLQNQVAQDQTILQQIKDIAKQQKTSTEELKQNTSDQLDKQTHYILCIAQFFATTDRNNKVIADLNTCSLQTTGGTSYIFPSSNTTTQGVSHTSVPAAQPQAQPQAQPTSSGAASTPPAAQPPPASPTPPAIKPKPPTLVQILEKTINDIVRP